MHTEKTVTTTDKKVLEAAKHCPTVKETLKTLFPEVFKTVVYPKDTLFVAVACDRSFIIFYDLEEAKKWANGGIGSEAGYRISVVYPKSTNRPYDNVIGDFLKP